jgi:hypothetical protein
MTVALLLAAAPDRLSAMAHPYWHPGDRLAGGAPWLDYMGDRLMSAGVRQVDVAMCADAADGLRAVAAAVRDIGEPVLVCTSTRALAAQGPDLAALLGRTSTAALAADGALLVARADLTAVADAAEDLAARIAAGDERLLSGTHTVRRHRLSVRRLTRRTRVNGDLDSAVEQLIECIPGHGVRVISLVGSDSGGSDWSGPGPGGPGPGGLGSGGPVGGAGVAAQAAGRARRRPGSRPRPVAAEPGLVAGLAVAPVAGRLARWAATLRMAPDALPIAAFALSLCAAAWYADGSRTSLITGSVLLGLALPLRQARGRRPGRNTDAVAFSDWLGVMTGAVADYAVYAGLAVGWLAERPHQAWTFAIAAMILLAVRQMTDACYAAVAPPRPQPAGAGHRLLRLAGQSIAQPAGERTILIAVATPVWGPRVTLLVLIGWSAVALGYVLAERAVTGGAPDPETPAQSAAYTAGAQAVTASRDDGPLATRMGHAVQGQLPPLLPTIAGVIVTVMLASVGLHNLPGPLILAPAAAMLLAALGAGNAHLGPFDWLVPPLLQAGEYVYLAAVGVGTGVPPPATFALIAAVALHHMDLLHRERRRIPPSPEVIRAGLGWEGRLLVVGIAGIGIFSIEPFVYIALAGYLWVLFGWDSLSSWLTIAGGGSR